MTETSKVTEETVTTVELSREEEKTSVLSNVLAIVGLIILSVIIIWGLVHLAGLSKSWFASLFPHSAPSIEVTAPTSVTSRISFTANWKYTPSESGSYAFLYQCQSGFSFQMKSTSGTWDQVPCGSALTLRGEGTSLELMPVLSGTQTISVPLSIIFNPSKTTSQKVQGSATVLVRPAQVAQTPSKPVVSAPAPAKPVGKPDLAVRIISVSADGAGNGVATFDIENIGSGPSGSYYFEAQIPTSAYGTYGQGYAYSSPVQSSLGAGDHVVSTLRFTQAQTGGIFSVTVDPSGSVHETNTANNYAYQSFSGGYYPQPYYAPSPYPYY